MKEDWRLNGQEEYLLGKKLLMITFRETSGSDHMHCEFCWAKISEDEDDFHNGYATLDGRFIICEECFHDFQESFQWTVDERIESFDDFLKKFELYSYKKMYAYTMPSLTEEKECTLCHKELKSDGTDEFCVATEDGRHWFCKACAEDFGPIFNWK